MCLNELRTEGWRVCQKSDFGLLANKLWCLAPQFDEAMDDVSVLRSRPHYLTNSIRQASFSKAFPKQAIVVPRQISNEP